MNKKYLPSALILYLNYFIHGVGCSILGQAVIKDALAGAWGVEAMAITAISAALGLGRLIALPFAGPLSDKLGRRISTAIGSASYAIYLIGLALAFNAGTNGGYTIAYVCAILGGIANSFLDTCVSPTCMEIYVNNPSVANMFTKFSMCISQFLLPYMIGAVASANMSYRTIFIVAGVAIFIDGILILFLPFPERGNKTAAAGQKTKSKLKITPAALAAILIGFTSSSTFMLWLNCNKELGMLYGMTSDQAGKIQSFYAIGTFAAILCSSVLIKKGLKEINILILYPAISTVTLLLCYFIQSPTMCLIGGFAIGFAGAGGVLQLATSTTAEFFPENKATATSMVMIASSIANYTILSLASYITKVGGEGAPRMILLLNAGVTVAGILLAIFVKKNKEA